MFRNKYKEIFGIERPSATYENAEQVDWIVTESEAEIINAKWGKETIKPGEKATKLLPPTTIEKAWERLVKLYAQFHCESLQINYFEKYKSIKKEILQEYLEDITSFIDQTKKTSIRRSFEQPDRSDKFEEYLRLEHGYYEMHYCENLHGCLASRVYGEYYLFKDWLIKQLGDHNNNNHPAKVGNNLFSSSPYSIDEEQVNIKNPDGTTTIYNKKPRNDYDLRNQNTYDSSGRIFTVAFSGDYDLQFAKKIDLISPVYNIPNFLTYHYEKTQDKPTFLKHVEYVILQYPFLLHNETKTALVKAWLNERKAGIIHVPGVPPPPENDYWKSEYELRQFIDLATRWSIDGVFNSRTKDNPFSIFHNYVSDAKNQFDFFSNQLNQKLSASPHWKAIEVDLYHRFIKMINQYKKWFNDNKNELEKFEPYNPYSLMLNVIESTRDEIEKYFPGISQEGYPATEANKEKPQQFTLNEKAKPTKSKLEFTDSKLRPIILELADLKGFDKPSTFLDELRIEVEGFNDFEFTCNFYIRVHHLCNENREKFWNESHKKDITKWLNKAPFASNIFDLTWTDYNKIKNPTEEKPVSKNQNPNKGEQKPEESRTRNFIAKELNTLDLKIGWSYAFRSESDYNTFLTLLTSFFENTPTRSRKNPYG